MEAKINWTLNCVNDRDQIEFSPFQNAIKLKLDEVIKLSLEKFEELENEASWEKKTAFMIHQIGDLYQTVGMKKVTQSEFCTVMLAHSNLEVNNESNFTKIKEKISYLTLKSNVPEEA